MALHAQRVDSMTLGFAGATWTENDERMVMVAGDTRISGPGQRITDAGVKTYELGGRSALVASGHALPPMMAAELTRSLIENHNRRTPDRKINFVDTVRLVSYFLKYTAEQQSAECRAAAAGFLKDGAPCMASITISPGFNRAGFFPVEQSGTSILPVGDESAARLLLHAVQAAQEQKRPRFAAALSILYYTANLRAAFETVGGGISVGTCLYPAEHFSWPITEFNEVLFLRGLNVTKSHRPSWPPPEVIPYDEAWCVAQDRLVADMPSQKLTDSAKKGTLRGFDIDSITPETLFTSHEEPDDLSPARQSSGPE